MMARHAEAHRIEHAGWLRAAVLGANDGLISTASLLLGVLAAGGDTRTLLMAGGAGLVAGAFSMAAGEYVSVSSQADAEAADLARERRELVDDPAGELKELAGLQQGRGLPPELAMRVAEALTAHDALEAHARDELGITAQTRARPLQAALASASAFAAGAAVPLVVSMALPEGLLRYGLVLSSLILLVGLGALAANLGGAPMGKAAARMGLWGGLAMAGTWLAGSLFGAIA